MDLDLIDLKANDTVVNTFNYYAIRGGENQEPY